MKLKKNVQWQFKILKKFLELGMLKKEGKTFLIKNWDKC